MPRDANEQSHTDIIDDLLDGRSIGRRKHYLCDVIELDGMLDRQEIEFLIVASDDQRIDKLDQIKRHVERKVVEWLKSERGQAALSERMDEMEEQREEEKSMGYEV